MLSNRRISILLLCTCLLLAASRANADPYEIGPDDVVRVQVLGHPDMTRDLTVSPDGNVFIPLLGKVQTAGLTYDQLAAKLTKQLGSGYINDPQVNVEVVEYNSKKVYVLGEVDKPWVAGRKAMYRLRSKTTLLEMIGEVGGPSKDASDYVIIVRRLDAREKARLEAETTAAAEKREKEANGKTAGDKNKENGEKAMAVMLGEKSGAETLDFKPSSDTISIKIKLSELMNGNLKLNIELKNGDVILFPGRLQNNRKVIVSGEAGRLGPMTLSETMTLAELISIVQAPIGPSDQLTLYTADDKGEQRTVEFLTKKILLGEAGKDYVLKDGDVLFFKKTPQTFYVIGEVKAPGGFYYRPDLTVREALVVAGWITQAASIGSIKAVRMKNGKWVEEKIKLEDKVEPGDIIQVPERWF